MFSFAQLEFLNEEIKNKNYSELQKKKLRNGRIFENGGDHLKMISNQFSQLIEDEYKKMHIFGIKADTDEKEIAQLLSKFNGIKVKVFPHEP